MQNSITDTDVHTSSDCLAIILQLKLINVPTKKLLIWPTVYIKIVIKHFKKQFIFSTKDHDILISFAKWIEVVIHA